MKLKNFTTTTQRINTSKKIMRNTNLTHLGKNLANALLVYHLNNRTGQCNPTVATLADELGSHRASIYKAIQRLQSHIGMQWIDRKFIFNLAEQVCADDHDDPASLEKKVAAGCGNGFGGSFG